MKLLGIDEHALPAWLRDMSAARDIVVTSALVNAHDHLHLNNVPPLPQVGFFRNSYEWIDAFQPHFDAPDVKAALMIAKGERMFHGAVKNLLCGATTVMHHDPWHAALDSEDFPVRVVRDYGWSHSLRLSQSRQYGPSMVESYMATPKDTLWFIHLAEGVDDVAAGELRMLDALGCLQANTVVIHGVGLSDADIALIIERGAHVVWCPSSNLRLFGQTISAPRLRRLFAAGLLAIGTDSRLTGAHDLLDELRVARACSDFSSAELFTLATSMSRVALKCVDSCDDVIVFADSCGDPFESLLNLRRGDLLAVIQRGKLMLIDEGIHAQGGSSDPLLDLAVHQEQASELGFHYLQDCSERVDRPVSKTSFASFESVDVDGKQKFIARSVPEGLGAARELGLS